MEFLKRMLLLGAVLTVSLISFSRSESRQCEPSPLVSSPRRTSPHIEDLMRPSVADNGICQSDPRMTHAGSHLKVHVNVLNSDCRAVAHSRLIVSQADSQGQEREDCGGEILTHEDGRVTVDTVRPKAYRDIKHPSKLRPRLIQFKLRPPSGCSFEGSDRDEEFITQFYFKKDRYRTNDPCPIGVCHANKPTAFFRGCRRTATHRICNATITLPHITCDLAPEMARSFAPTPSVVFTHQPAAHFLQPDSPIAQFAQADLPTEAPVCARVPATQWDTPGPFYKDNQRYRNPMCAEDPNYEFAEKLTLNFKLTDRSCRVLNDFRIDVWSADTRARYDNDYCRSLMSTNSSGMFTLKTIKPPPYPGRPRHMHYLVHATRVDNLCYHSFTTQSYFSAERFDYASLVKPCRFEFRNGHSVGQICDFNIVLHDPQPC